MVDSSIICHAMRIDGWLSSVDCQLLISIGNVQHQVGMEGDILEIGAYSGKSAVLFGGLLAKGERLHVIDPFSNRIGLADENVAENEKLYPSVDRELFLENYRYAHEIPPIVHEGPSVRYHRAFPHGGFRIVHIDGSHLYENVKGDIAFARNISDAHCVVIIDDFRNPVQPGVAFAAWEAVAERRIFPFLVSWHKLYAAVSQGEANAYASAIGATLDEQGLTVLQKHELAGVEVSVVRS